jgi:hypothetical protein
MQFMRGGDEGLPAVDAASSSGHACSALHPCRRSTRSSRGRSEVMRSVGGDWFGAPPGRGSPGVGGVSPMLLPPVAVVAPPQLALPAPWSPHTPQLAM